MGTIYRRLLRKFRKREKIEKKSEEKTEKKEKTSKRIFKKLVLSSIDVQEALKIHLDHKNLLKPETNPLRN